MIAGNSPFVLLDDARRTAGILRADTPTEHATAASHGTHELGESNTDAVQSRRVPAAQAKSARSVTARDRALCWKRAATSCRICANL